MKKMKCCEYDPRCVSSVVEQLAHHPKFEGLNLAAANTEREETAKKDRCVLLLPSFVIGQLNKKTMHVCQNKCDNKMAPFNLEQGVQKQMRENLKIVWPQF